MGSSPEPDVLDVHQIQLVGLVEHRVAVPANLTVEATFETFRGIPHEFMGVLEGDRFVGMVSRGQLGFLLGGRFGFAVHSRDPVRQHLLPNPACATPQESLLVVLDRVLRREGDDVYDDIALLDGDGRFLGVIPVQTMVRLQTRLILEQARLAEAQHAALEEKTRQLFRSVNELRQSQGRYEILFDNSVLGVALLNSQGEVETRNHQMERLLGLGPPDLGVAPVNLTRWVVPAERESFQRFLEHEVQAQPGDASLPSEFTLELPGRGRRLFRFFSSWIAETGQVCVLMDDITEQRVLERRVAQREKSALIESLVGGIAHELNNKLSPILGYADLLAAELADEGDPARLTEYCQTIRSSAVDSAKIIRQLLQLSRPETPDFAVCDLAGVATDALAILRYRFRQAAVEVIFEPPPAPVLILGDASQLKQVVLNLTLNALDAMDRSALRELRLVVQREPTYAVLALTDTGHGIASEHANRIFDPFFTTKSPDRGTGLGLSVCYSIVKQHRGEIQVDSVAGVGTTFRIQLPPAGETEVRLRAHVASTVAAPERAPVALPPRLRVLVVDDEDFITGLVQEALRRELKCHVDRVHTARRATERMLAEDYHLVISDVRMPETDGFGLVEWIRQHRPGLLERFLFITGDAGSRDLQDRLLSMRLPVLRKPFELPQLTRTCLDLLETAGRKTAPHPPGSDPSPGRRGE